jgi:vancomycin resistance protein YoaR
MVTMHKHTIQFKFNDGYNEPYIIQFKFNNGHNEPCIIQFKFNNGYNEPFIIQFKFNNGYNAQTHNTIQVQKWLQCPNTQYNSSSKMVTMHMIIIHNTVKVQ